MFNFILKLFEKKPEARGANQVYSIIPVLITGSTGSSQVDQKSRSVSTSQVDTPASNIAAVITLITAGVGVSNVISGIAWSYTADPVGGNLMVENGSGIVIFSVDITNQGPGFIPFNPPKKGSTNTAMIITLSAGGVGVTGKVNLLNSWTE